MIEISANEVGASSTIHLPPLRYKYGVGHYLVRRSGLSEIGDGLTQDLQTGLLTAQRVMIAHGGEAGVEAVESGVGHVVNGLSNVLLRFADAMLVIMAAGIVAVPCQLTLTHLIGRDANIDNWIIAVAELIAIGGICGLATRIPHQLAFPLAAFSLIKLIHEIETDESAWGNVERRAEWAGRLDRIADRWIDIGDVFAIKGKRRDKEVVKAFAEISAGIRSRRLWLVSPCETTRQELLAYLVRLLNASFSGNLHCLREDVGQPNRTIPERIASTSRTVVLSFLPLVGIEICRYTFPSLSIPISVKATAEVGWPIAVIMSAMSGNAKSPVETAKEIISIAKAAVELKH